MHENVTGKCDRVKNKPQKVEICVWHHDVYEKTKVIKKEKTKLREEKDTEEVR